MKKASIEEIAELLPKKNGNFAAIARALGVSRGTIQNRVKSSARLKRLTEDAREGMKDNAESSLYAAVLAGNVTACIFFLKCQAKDRGYVERQEFTGRDGGPMDLRENPSQLTDEELRERAMRIPEAFGDDAGAKSGVPGDPPAAGAA